MFDFKSVYVKLSVLLILTHVNLPAHAQELTFEHKLDVKSDSKPEIIKEKFEQEETAEQTSEVNAYSSNTKEQSNSSNKTTKTPSKNDVKPPKNFSVSANKSLLSTTPTATLTDKITTENSLTTVSSDSIKNANPKGMAIMQQFGKVVHSQALSDGITAWVIEKNQKRIIFYTSPNYELLISGQVWNAKTKLNISKTLAKHVQNSEQPLLQKMQNSTLNNVGPTNLLASSQINKINVNTPTPESILMLDQLSGVKENKQNPRDTLYIVIDPRCPYCQKTYSQSRDYIANGKSIKWIPAIVLGQSDKALEAASYLLQTSNATVALEDVLKHKKWATTIASSNTLKSLQRNRDYFYLAVEKNAVTPAGVPLAFFFDKRTQKARILTGIHHPAIMQDVFKGIDG